MQRASRRDLRQASSQSGRRRLTMVVPTLNERENLERMVESLLDLELRDVDLSVLVADNDSPDGTGQLADALARRYAGRVAVLHLGGVGGLGAAYVRAFTHALATGAELIGQMDCDFSHPVDALPRMLAEARHADMVLGSRYAPGGGTTEAWPWARQLLSTFANSVYVRTALGIPLADATGGFRIWRRETLLGMDFTKRVRSDGYVFQVEMSYLAWRLGYRLREVPILFAERAAGDSKMSLAIQAEAAWRVFQVRRRHGGLAPSDRALGHERSALESPTDGRPAPARQQPPVASRTPTAVAASSGPVR